VAVRVKLNDSIEIVVDASVKEIRDALRAALQNSELLEIAGPNGGEVAVNPHQVLYIEAIDAPMSGAGLVVRRARESRRVPGKTRQPAHQ
jgi:hypothetical protein